MGTSIRRDLAILAAFTLLLHLPFLTQPVQGDEVNYLETAREVFRQPLTPLNFEFVFQGRRVSMAGAPHPPLTAYMLTLPWMMMGRFSLTFFHIFYLLFAVGISFAAYALAAYFTSRPLWAALLVAACPLVQVNTNTVASPEPLSLAFLLLGAAAFFWQRYWISGIALTLAGLSALQALILPPILLLAFWVKRERPPRAALLAMSAPYVGMAAWQGLQWRLTDSLPGAMLVGHMRGSSYGRLSLKAESAFALLEHLGALVTLLPVAVRRLWGLAPGLIASALVHGYAWWERGLLVLFTTLGVNALLWLWESRKSQPVLANWGLIYFAFAALAFFAGASRYLLPLVAPMVLLLVLEYGKRPRWLGLALGINLFLGLNISFAAYEFSRVYAEVAPPPGGTFLVNGEWGFRYYMLRRGGRTLESSSIPKPGEWIVSSELSLAGNYDSLAEETAVPVRTTDLWVRTPLRLIDRSAHTGFSSAALGLLPFSFSSAPLDRISYSHTSPFLNVLGDWMPTQFSGHLVYLPRRGASVRLPMATAAAQLRFALFARGRGTTRFLVRSDSGAILFEKDIALNGDLWERHTLTLPGGGGVVMSAEAPSTVQAGWGELISDGPIAAGQPEPQPPNSYLNMGDIRIRPQLLAGWYGIEDGAWRWMAQQAEAVVRAPLGVPVRFEMQLYFPPKHMERAGGPVTVSIWIDDRLLGRETYSQPGGYSLAQAVPHGLLTSATSRLSIRLSRAVPANETELRELGAVVQGVGFVEIK